MIDFGIDKLAIVGAVALIVIGPEKLPRVARTVGALLGKAQRYVADVKAEVNRSIELEELGKMKSQFESAARDMQQTVESELRAAGATVRDAMDEAMAIPGTIHHPGPVSPLPAYRPPKKNWRMKRSAVPQWYKHRAGVRTHALSGAARVARFRPRAASK